MMSLFNNKGSNKGFTLIEIIISIVILALFFSVLVYVLLDTVKNSKEKSYEVTINNIENIANDYVFDKMTSSDWINGDSLDYQYQCVTVQKLIDAGYFKEDILDAKIQSDLFVKRENYVYLERETNTKNIIKSILLYDSDNIYNERCEYMDILLDASFLIEYNANGGSGSMEDTVCEYGSYCAISENKFVRAGYRFVGWTTNSDGSNDSYGWTGWKGNWSFENGDNGILDNKLVLYAIWENAYSVNIKYKIQDGEILTLMTTDDNNTYNWVLDEDGLIYKDVNVNGIYDILDEPLITKVKYGNITGEDGLVDYNNKKYINIKKTGYSGLIKGQWECLSGDCEGKNYNQFGIDEGVQYKSDDFCDASKGDCIVVLGVNWIGNEYTITYIVNAGYSDISLENKEYCSYTAEGDDFDLNGTMKSSTTCRYGESCSLEKMGYTRDCHQFIGWTTNRDVEETDYTTSITHGNNTDAFYADNDTFIYNTLGDIDLYAIWKSTHNWKASGIQLLSTSGEYTCKYYHHEAYTIYCTECQMSVAHYNLCYLNGYERRLSIKYCPCTSYPEYVFDDHTVYKRTEFGTVATKLTLMSNENIYARGGLIEEQIKFNKVSSSERVTKCVEHK